MKLLHRTALAALLTWTAPIEFRSVAAVIVSALPTEHEMVLVWIGREGLDNTARLDDWRSFSPLLQDLEVSIVA